MKVVAISDLHNKFYNVTLPVGDILAIAGDWTGNGTLYEIKIFFDWLKIQANNFRHVVFVAGNHDWLPQLYPELFASLCEIELPKNVYYLENHTINIEGHIIYGSPITPHFCDWAFMPDLESRIAAWEKIPQECDLLITHGPAAEILDTSIRGAKCGCPHLLNYIQSRKVKNHIFGHIHEAYGTTEAFGCKFFNVSAVNVNYQRVNQAIVFDI